MRHHVADMHETWKEQSPCSTTFSLELELILWARFALLIYYFTGGYAIA
jgi:hypothetical protein